MLPPDAAGSLDIWGHVNAYLGDGPLLVSAVIAPPGLLVGRGPTSSPGGAMTADAARRQIALTWAPDVEAASSVWWEHRKSQSCQR